MAQYKDIDKPNSEKHLDKAKGEQSIREAASMELPMQGSEAQRTEIPMQGTTMEPGREEIPMKVNSGAKSGRSAGESVSEIVDDIFVLPFRAQLGILRTIAPKILGAMDVRDRDGFLRDLGAELARAEVGEPTYDVRPPNEQDVPGPSER